MEMEACQGLLICCVAKPLDMLHCCFFFFFTVHYDYLHTVTMREVGDVFQLLFQKNVDFLQISVTPSSIYIPFKPLQSAYLIKAPVDCVTMTVLGIHASRYVLITICVKLHAMSFEAYQIRKWIVKKPKNKHIALASMHVNNSKEEIRRWTQSRPREKQLQVRLR